MEECFEYVKRHGISRTILDLSIVEKHGYNSLFTDDFTKKLKQIVDAFEWVEKFGGLDGFKDEYMSRIENNECVSGMNKAIELVEKCDEIQTTSNSE